MCVTGIAASAAPRNQLPPPLPTWTAHGTQSSVLPLALVQFVRGDYDSHVYNWCSIASVDERARVRLRAAGRIATEQFGVQPARRPSGLRKSAVLDSFNPFKRWFQEKLTLQFGRE